MTTEEKAKAYDEALEQAQKELAACGSINCDAARQIFRLFPELRESEDERIRKELIDQLQYIIPEEGEYDEEGLVLPQYHERINRYRAYLEKQKDHFRDDTKMVEQKPRDYCSLRDEFDLEGNLVQKPTSTEDMPYITDEHFYERESADSFKYKLAEYMTKCCTKKESPYGYTYSISSEAILKMAEEELLKRGVVQKPAEWSEEDERMLKSVLWVLESYVSKDECGESPALTATYQTYFKEIAWLKSLRSQPHWKPSDEQLRPLEYAIDYFKKKRNDTTYLESLYNDLKKLM